MGDHSHMRKAIFMLLAGIAGCSAGGGDSPNSASCLTTYGYDTDQYSETGLTLRATTPHYSFITFEEMEAEYIDVELCAANTNTPGPDIIFDSFEAYNFPFTLALYYYAQATVYIDTDVHDYLPIRNCISDREFLRHEYMHHILYLNGEDPEHTNPKFEQCNALGPKTCNGEYCE
jgi:hypothetical protein